MLADQAFAFARGLQCCQRVLGGYEQYGGGPLGFGGIPDDNALAAPQALIRTLKARAATILRINLYQSVTLTNSQVTRVSAPRNGESEIRARPQ